MNFEKSAPPLVCLLRCPPPAQHGQTPLHRAARAGGLEAALALLAHGADPCARDEARGEHHSAHQITPSKCRLEKSPRASSPERACSHHNLPAAAAEGRHPSPRRRPLLPRVPPREPRPRPPRGRSRCSRGGGRPKHPGPAGAQGERPRGARGVLVRERGRQGVPVGHAGGLGCARERITLLHSPFLPWPPD